MQEEDASIQLRLISSEETVGQILSSVRISWKLTAEEVAARLNLSVDTIHALESDDYARLPGSTFIKGYVRSYAALLRLNPAEVLEHLNLEADEVRKNRFPGMPLRIPQRQSKPKSAKKLGRVPRILLGLLLLGWLGLIGWHYGEKLDATEVAAFFKLPLAGDRAGNGDKATDSISRRDGQQSGLIRIE